MENAYEDISKLSYLAVVSLSFSPFQASVNGHDSKLEQLKPTRKYLLFFLAFFLSFFFSSFFSFLFVLFPYQKTIASISLRPIMMTFVSFLLFFLSFFIRSNLRHVGHDSSFLLSFELWIG